MDFELTDEQLELQRIAREVAERECPPAVLRAVVEDGTEAEALWKTVVGLDWPALAVPVEEGGSGASTVELVVLLEQLGWAGDPTPLLGTATQHVPLVLGLARGEVRAELLAAACAGVPGAAVDGRGSLRARPEGPGWVLEGTVAHTMDADRAEQLAVIADADEGAVVAFVPATAVSIEREPSIDASLHLATVRFDGTAVAGERVAAGPDVAAAAERAWQEALTGLAAVTVGATQRVFDLAMEHIRERRQFGVPIGSFQALKHMAVDAYTAIERARAVVQYAALAIAEDDPRRTVAAHMAKAAAGDAQRITVQHGVQMFGALGYTWENDLHLYVRRVKAADALLGPARQHRARLARLVLADLSSEDPR